MSDANKDLYTVLRAGVELLGIREIFSKHSDQSGVTSKLIMIAREMGITGNDTDDTSPSALDALSEFEIFALGIAYAFRYERSAWEMLDIMGAREGREFMCDGFRVLMLRAL